jgi:hypothetical protein
MQEVLEREICTACADPATRAIGGDAFCKECFLELRYGVIPKLRSHRRSARITRLDLIRSAERAMVWQVR